MLNPLTSLRGLLSLSERRQGIFLFGLMVIGMTLEIVCTGLILPAVALMMQQDLAPAFLWVRRLADDALGTPTQSQITVLVMFALVAIYFVKNAFLAFLAWRQTRFAYHVQIRLSQLLFSIYLRQPYTFHLQRNSAQLIRNVANEVNLVTEAIVGGLIIGTELLVLLGISCLLLLVEPVGTFAAVLVLGASAWVFHRVTRRRIAHWGATRHEHDVLRFQHLQQGLGGVKDVTLLGRQHEFIEQYRAHNVETARAGQNLAVLQMLPRLWLELLAVVGLATLVVTMLAQGREIAAILPALGLFAAAAFRLMPSVNRLLNGTQLLRYTQPAVETLREELKLVPVDPIESETRGTPRTSNFAEDIHLEEVSFTYPGASRPAIRGISLRIRKSESIGIIGPSGCGKSTLVDVILGLLTPETGAVLIDGRNLQAGLRAWQDQIGYVPQSIYLTDDSLRRNVAFGVPENAIDEEAVNRAIRAAQLDDLVASLPNGLSTVVGERGVRLSGGQRQRIGIARALYHDPAVLVLDEATSALDATTERGVMEAVAALHNSKTILIVAHRLSTVDDCDRLYRLDSGELVEEVRQYRSTQRVPTHATSPGGFERTGANFDD